MRLNLWQRIGQVFLWLLRFYVLWAIIWQFLPWPWSYGPVRYQFPAFAERLAIVNFVLIIMGTIVGYILVALTPIWIYILHFRLRERFPETYTITTFSLSGVLFVPFYGVFLLVWKLLHYRAHTADFLFHDAFTSDLTGWKKFLSSWGSRLFLAWFALFAILLGGVLSVNSKLTDLLLSVADVGMVLAIIGTVLIVVTSFMKTDPTGWKKSLSIWASRLLFIWLAIWAAIVLGLLSVNLYAGTLVPLGTVFLTVTSLWRADIFSSAGLYLDFLLPLAFLAVLTKVVSALEAATNDQLPSPLRSSSPQELP